MRSRAPVLALALLMLASPGAAVRARASEPPPDAELLEFLGTVDTAENGLKEYLERTDVEKMAANRAPATVQGTTPRPVAAGHTAADARPVPATSTPAAALEPRP